MIEKNIKIIKFMLIIFTMLLAVNIVLSIVPLFDKKTEDIFNENIEKTVEIKFSDDEENWGYATGFFIDEDGTILTNKHVIENPYTYMNCKTIQVRLASDENWQVANVLKVSNDQDLATLKIEKQNTKFFKIASVVKDGETVYTIGNPNGFGLSFSSGVVSSSKKIVVYNEKSISAIQTSLVINEGNSGGAVFNKEGNLLGIISFRLKDKNGDVLQGMAFALSQETISNFLSE